MPKAKKGLLRGQKYQLRRNIQYALRRLNAPRIGHGLALGRGMTKERSGEDVTPEEMIEMTKKAEVTVEVTFLARNIV